MYALHMAWLLCVAEMLALPPLTRAATATSIRAPSIEARGNDLVLSIPDGAQVKIIRLDEDGEVFGPPEDVLTRSEVQTLLQDGLDSNRYYM